jgi:photosystem II stability/assembly factor-like uncharacterized protein
MNLLTLRVKRLAPTFAFAMATALTILLAGAGSAAALSTGNGGWKWQDPLPHGTVYQGAYFTSATRGWLVSDNCIFRTTNGGATLKIQANHNVQLRDITFVGSKRGWAVGLPMSRSGRVIIYRTTNGGASWARIPLDQKGWLNAVVFANKNVGWAVGGRTGGSLGTRSLVLKTVDGGLTWVRQATGIGSATELRDVSCTSASRAWAVSDDTGVWRTTNGGAKWKKVANVDETPCAVAFRTSSVGWLAAWGKVWRSDDGGATWTTQLDLGLAGPEITDMDFADANNGWVVGGNGSAYTTTDGGTHWTATGAYSTKSWVCVDAVAGTTAVLGGGGGRLDGTTDGGATWASQPTVAAGYAGDLHSMDFTDTSNGWIAAGDPASGPLPATSGVLHTANGGAGWSWQTTGTAQPLYGIDFVDELNGWAAGAGGAIVHTANGGTAWGPQASGTTADLMAVSFVDPSTGWAVGDDFTMLPLAGGGIVRHTTNGGTTWTAQTSPLFAYHAFYDVAFADSLHGWAVGWGAGEGDGEPAVIFGTSDGGATWARQLAYIPPVSHSVGTATFRGIAALDATHAVAVGWADDNDSLFPIVYRTTDGTHWTKATVPTTWWSSWVSLNDVSFASSTRGWAVGSNGTVLRTTNAGKTWTKLRSGVGGDLNSVSFVNTKRGWAAGDFAAIVRTTTGGLAP